MNRVFVVTQGINPRPDARWFVAERKPNGSLQRVKSKHLPMTVTKEDCEDNLLHWLWIHCTYPSERLKKLTFEIWLERNGRREKVLSEGVSVWAFR